MAPRGSTRPHRPALVRTSAAGTVAAAVMAGVIIAAALIPGTAGASADSGATDALRATAGASFGVPAPGTYRPPLVAPVSDPFREPAHRYGPGNRGIEYRTVPGRPIAAIGAGQVVFAGPVGGRRSITILHPDGRRSSYTWVADIDVAVGQLVARGELIATASTLLHLGVREGERYVDPAMLFGLRRRAVLVPAPSGTSGVLGDR